MRLAVMQPYFFPYLGYFSLIAATDHFVVFDPVQYIRRGWVNRNRILKPDFVTPQYINVPVAKSPRETIIREVKIAENTHWKEKIRAQLQHYKKHAPFFGNVMLLLDECFAIETDCISKLNLHCLKIVCKSIEIPFMHSDFHEIENKVEPANHPGEWALNVSEVMGANEYFNPVGGKDIFEASEFAMRDIKLSFVENRLSQYSQQNRQFVPGLSIIDVMMFNSPEQTNKLVENYEISSVS